LYNEDATTLRSHLEDGCRRLGYSVVFPPGWAQGKRTKSVPSELALNVSRRTRNPERAIEPNFALIEKVQAIDLGQHVQVRVVGNGALSCASFPLAAPDRLVLDCPGAHVRAGSTPTRVTLIQSFPFALVSTRPMSPEWLSNSQARLHIQSMRRHKVLVTLTRSIDSQAWSPR